MVYKYSKTTESFDELIPSNVLGESFVNDWRRFQVGIFVRVYLTVRGFQTEKVKQIIRTILLIKTQLYKNKSSLLRNLL